MSFYPEPDINIKDRVKVALESSYYATKKDLDHAAGLDTSDLEAKNNLIALKTKVEKLDIKKLVDVPTSLKNHKQNRITQTQLKLKTVSVDLKEVSDLVDNEVARKI